VNDNLLKQQFQATEPYTVLHTDITQVRLANQHFRNTFCFIDIEQIKDCLFIFVEKQCYL
ncbi:hypothetical protein, partial [Bombilactobacillus bombi]|uniref:hypothetical protein n=1 Tax=Bombilactobacillus bombi TaxID=1303590 RepID=UPI001C6393ED